ncbi:MAG TPA: hypothetical protein VG754_13260 [Verrucomicrobiae bacterium]|nr:hypothetical protein [Verrucomicrobiae bacterium]
MTDNDHFGFDPSAALFGPNELSLDLFGYSATKDKGGGDHQAWGPGVAVNYFFTENLGVGAEGYADAFETPYLLNALGEFRYPVPGVSWFAPHVFLGLGREWANAPQWMGHFGGGAELRFNANTGLLIDVRRVFCVNSPDYTLVRFGFRITF